MRLHFGFGVGGMAALLRCKTKKADAKYHQLGSGERSRGDSRNSSGNRCKLGIPGWQPERSSFEDRLEESLEHS